MNSKPVDHLADVYSLGAMAYVRCRRPADVYAVGSTGTLLHWDGVSWSPVASGTNDGLYAVWGDAAP